MSIDANELKVAAMGRWDYIFLTLGVDVGVGKHQPCPSCGGTDRFRLINDKDGGYYCNGCGPGDGLSLVRKVFGLSFPDTLKKVADVIGYEPRESDKPFATKPDPAVRLNKLWAESKTLTAGDPVSKYLESRGIAGKWDDIRYHAACWEPDTKKQYPAMIAKIKNSTGTPVSLHRTYLTKDGRKADIEKVKKLMPGKGGISGCSVQLLPCVHGNELGIAEGIETAMSVTKIYKIPCWATLSTSGMMSFIPPDGVNKITIFGDNDKNFAGHAAAYSAAKRLSGKIDIIRVVIPKTCNDFNDLLI